MGHCHRASFGDLLAETWDDGAVGAEDVAETGGHELGSAFFPAGFDGKAKRLDIDLRQTFGATHDVGRVDCLVGGHHDHLLDIIFYTFVSYVA